MDDEPGDCWRRALREGCLLLLVMLPLVVFLVGLGVAIYRLSGS